MERDQLFFQPPPDCIIEISGVVTSSSRIKKGSLLRLSHPRMMKNKKVVLLHAKKLSNWSSTCPCIKKMSRTEQEEAFAKLLSHIIYK